MRKYFFIRSFWGTCSSVKILKGYILICWNAVGVHIICRNAEGVCGKKKVGNPCSRQHHLKNKILRDWPAWVFYTSNCNRNVACFSKACYCCWLKSIFSPLLLNEDFVATQFKLLCHFHNRIDFFMKAMPKKG